MFGRFAYFFQKRRRSMVAPFNFLVKSAFIVFLFFFSSSVWAQGKRVEEGFKLDIPLSEILAKTSKLTINSLAVGDYGYINPWESFFCKTADNEIFLFKFTGLVVDREEYSSYIKVTRLAGGALDFELTDRVGKRLQGKKLLQSLVSVAWRSPCEWFDKSLWVTTSFEEVMFQIRSVNGSASLRDLFTPFFDAELPAPD